MFYGKLDDFEVMGLRSLGAVVSRSVDWIRELPANPKERRYELGARNLHALVMCYSAVEAADSRSETHRKYVDLQYTLASGEAIEWTPRRALAHNGDYDADKDLLFHRPGPALTRVMKSAAYFAIYTPVDAHRPKIRVEGFGSVSKLVVKIPVGLFPHL